MVDETASSGYSRSVGCHVHSGSYYVVFFFSYLPATSPIVLYVILDGGGSTTACTGASTVANCYADDVLSVGCESNFKITRVCKFDMC